MKTYSEVDSRFTPLAIMFKSLAKVSLVVLLLLSTRIGATGAWIGFEMCFQPLISVYSYSDCVNFFSVRARTCSSWSSDLFLAAARQL